MRQIRSAENTSSAAHTREDTALERIFPKTSMVVPTAVTTKGLVSTFSEALVQALFDMGIRDAFAVFGGVIAPFCEALSRSSIRLTHYRHEAGAAFAAIEASLASDRPVLVVATAGPGVTNLVTGMAAARWEGAKVLFVSGCTPPELRGRWAFQESSSNGVLLDGLYSSGHLFHHAQIIEDVRELPTAMAKLRAGWARPNGYVAHLGLPLSLQVADTTPVEAHATSSVIPSGCDLRTVQECIRQLQDGPFVIWVGFGARHAAQALRDFAQRADAKVICSPRAKGIISEDDPRLLGVTGLGGYGPIEEYFAHTPPQRILVLGSRLGEMTSFWQSGWIPEGGLIHVDLEPSVFGAAFPNVPTLGIQSEISAFLEQALEAWPERSTVTTSHAQQRDMPSLIAMREHGPVRPSFLMQAIQREIVEQTSAIVLAESGNAFSLGSHHLRFREPRRYRVSTGFGSMGHAAAGVVGATMNSTNKAVAIVGDGAMLMLNEINTAATYGIPALWIVLNNAGYGMIAQGMRSLGWVPFETDFARADFVAIARAMGATGIRVDTEPEVTAALRIGIQASGPFVIDVAIDANEMAPSKGRNRSLSKQGLETPKR